MRIPPRPRPRLLPAALGILVSGLAALGGAGCGPKTPPPGPPWLTDARVQGPEADWDRLYPRHPDLPATVPGERGRSAAIDTSWAARLALDHPVPAWWEQAPFVRRFYPLPPLDRETLEADELRVRDWFIDQGFLEAEVGLTVEPDPTWWGQNAERKAPGSAWRAIFTVQTGPRWDISRVDLVGEELLEGELRRALLAALPVATGDHYTGASRRAAEAALRHAMASRGHPYPFATSVLVPDPVVPGGPRTATLLFHVDPGTPARFGTVRYHGLELLDRGRVRRAIQPRFSPGDPWDQRALERLELGLDRLPAFAEVTARPGTIEADGTTPVHVRVDEAEAGGWSPVLGLSSEASLYSVELGAAWQGNHVGRGLASGRFWTQAGYRAMPVLFGPSAFLGNHGPVGGSGMEAEFFVRPLAGISVFTGASGRLDTWRGYHQATAGARAGLRWRPSRHLTLSFAPEVGWWRSFATPAQEPLFVRWFDSEVPGPPPAPMDGMQRPRFRSQALVLRPHIDLRYVQLDDRASPQSGAVVEGTVVPWGRADADSWTRAELAVHGFVPVLPERLVLAPSLRGGWMAWHQDDVLQAIPTRFFAGGVGTVRGWSTRMLNPPGWDGDINDVRIGGNVMLTGTLEGRFRIWPQLHLIGFVDSGRVWERMRSIENDRGEVIVAGVDLGQLQTSTGIGIQVPSPLGTVVTSIALRLNRETDLGRPVPPGNFHFALVEHF